MEWTWQETGVCIIYAENLCVCRLCMVIMYKALTENDMLST